MQSIEGKVDGEEEVCVVTEENYEIYHSSNDQSQALGEQQDGGKDEKSGDPESKETFMEAASSKALRPFVIISSSYLLFTITDGAIRMIVLLHAYNKDFSALEVSIMFTLYELAGVFTNLVGQEINVPIDA